MAKTRRKLPARPVWLVPSVWPVVVLILPALVVACVHTIAPRHGADSVRPGVLD